MFQKILTGFVAALVMTSVAIAGGRSVGEVIRTGAKESGKSEKEFREDLVRALEKETDISPEKLKKLRRNEEVDLDLDKMFVERPALNDRLKTYTGYDLVVKSNLAQKAGKDFAATASKRATEKARQDALVKQTSVKIDTDFEINAKDMKARDAIIDTISKTTWDAIKAAGRENYPGMLKLGKIWERRIRETKDPVEKARLKKVAENLMVLAARSVGPFEGETVLGYNINEACLKMKPEAVENMVEFIRGGEEVNARNIDEYSLGMAKAAAKKFEQELEDGIARVRALAEEKAGCGLYNGKIGASLAKMVKGG